MYYKVRNGYGRPEKLNEVQGRGGTVAGESAASKALREEIARRNAERGHTEFRSRKAGKAHPPELQAAISKINAERGTEFRSRNEAVQQAEAYAFRDFQPVPSDADIEAQKAAILAGGGTQEALDTAVDLISDERAAELQARINRDKKIESGNMIKQVGGVGIAIAISALVFLAIKKL